MKKIPYFFLIVLVFIGCAGQPQPLPPPTSVEGGKDLKFKYQNWTDAQLQLKRVQLRHEFDKDYLEIGPPLMMAIARGKREAKQKEIEEIEQELLRRDPTGKLLIEVSEKNEKLVK